MDWSIHRVVWNFILFLTFLITVDSNFINFRPEYEYIYRFSSHATIKDVGKFVIEAKVRCVILKYMRSK